MSGPTPRELLDQADRERRTANAADTARAFIRLYEKPVQRRGLLGFPRKRPEERDVFFDADQTFAIYRALAIVRNEANKRADELEAQVTTSEGVRP